MLLTNDFPPKVGGIQSYLWELWRRLPSDRVTVITGADPYAGGFDSAQPFRIERLPHKIVVPTAQVCDRVRGIAREVAASLIVIDPILPLGIAGPRIDLPYGIVLHGAEVAAPARLPATRPLMKWVLNGSSVIIAAGSYAATHARHLASTSPGGPAICEVPPGVDLERFHPATPGARRAARAEFHLPAEGRLVLAVSRLVPRKGIDTVIKATARLAARRPDLSLAVAGTGRDRKRLERLAAANRAPVRFLGEVPDGRLADLYACADVFAVPCRSRWGGLEQEGFGIVFLEAGACGVPQIAGASGGAAEAVVDGETGTVVQRPDDPLAVEAALAQLLDDPELRAKLGEGARRRAHDQFNYDKLAAVLDGALRRFE